MPQILADLQAWLTEQSAYRRQAIDYAAIIVSNQQIRLGELQASHLVFCEGYKMQHNPWFGDLPLQPDKGEFLRVRAKTKLCSHIINGAHMLVPLADGSYRFGATHKHSDFDQQPTEEARAQLQAGLNTLLRDTSDVEILEQDAGVRPATSDRQPFIGSHPQHPRLHLFNGFGARGALSIPWFAEQFAAHLLHGAALPPEAAIARYPEFA